MGELSKIRDALKANLATIEGLRVSDIIPDSINPPMAIVGGPELIEYDTTMARGADRLLIPVRVYAARTNERTGQDKLDSYITKSGSTSIKAAIESDTSLGGQAHTVRVQQMRGYGSYTVGGADYIGAEWLVEVIS